MKRIAWGWIAVALLVGCEDSPATKPVANANKSNVTAPNGAPAPPAPPAAPAPPSDSPAAAVTPKDEPKGTATKFEVGDGKKGRGYGNSIMTVPFSAYFSVQERLAIDQIKHAMDLYKAEHERYPKTKEAFMKEIIEEGQIKLPQLPDGESYDYDPKTGDLLVVRPGE